MGPMVNEPTSTIQDAAARRDGILAAARGSVRRGESLAALAVVRSLTRLGGMARIMTIMARRQPYTLLYARRVTKHLKAIDAKYDRLIRDNIEEQLRFEPNLETKNRKPLRQPAAFGAHWEIRFGPDNRFRAFYSVQGEAVILLAFGEKKGNRLWIEEEEVET